MFYQNCNDLGRWSASKVRMHECVVIELLGFDETRLDKMIIII